MEKINSIKNYCKQFNLGGVAMEAESIIATANSKQCSYLDLCLMILHSEAKYREKKSFERNLKVAGLPLMHNLDQYDFSFENGIKKSQLNELKELSWLDQIYNIILMGPSGTGKSYLSAGLCYHAILKGYKAYFRTMESIIQTLKMKNITRTALSEYKRLGKANLIVIDDIMLFPIDKMTAVNLFNFINQLFEKTSFIITTNKSPSEWALLLDDEVLATAMLDRLLYRCEVVNLTGSSYRLKNRKTIFSND